MGMCNVLETYLEDRQYVVDHLEELPEKCKECIRLNEEELKKKE